MYVLHRVFSKPYSALPGFGLTLGFSLFYLSLVVVLPLSALFLKAAEQTWASFITVAFTPRALAAYRLSFGGALSAAFFNAFVGTLIAWVLVRYRFPGKRFIDMLVDLPFALPTAVAGIALTTLYAPNGWIGKIASTAGLSIAYTPVGITIAMIFVGLPFVIRTVEASLRDASHTMEEAALLLGASAWQRFYMIILPHLWPALCTGTTMAFSRALAEYGSIIFIAGNHIGYTEIAPLLIVIKREQHDYIGAASIAVVMLMISFILLLLATALQKKWLIFNRKEM